MKELRFRKNADEPKFKLRFEKKEDRIFRLQKEADAEAKPRELRFVKPPASEPDKYPSGHFRNFTAAKFQKQLFKISKRVAEAIEFIDGICEDKSTTDAQRKALRAIRPRFVVAAQVLPVKPEKK